MNLLILILLVIGTVLITISNVFIIVLKDCILTPNILENINIMRKLRRNSWTPKPCSVTC